MNKFVKKWTTDSQLYDDIIKNIELYLLQFSESDSLLVLKLLNELSYFDSNSFKRLVNSYLDKLVQFTMDFDMCLFKSLIDDTRNHNSYEFVSNFKGIITIDFSEMNNRINNYDTIIFVDDFSGTGSSFIKMLEKIEPLIENEITIYFIPLFITQYSIDEINDFLKRSNFTKLKVKFNLSISTYRRAAYIHHNKIFSDVEINSYYKLCRKLEINENYDYGYKRTEELISFHHFTPNNTFGLLWHPGNLYIPIFSRNGNTFNQKNKYLSKNEINNFKGVIVRSNNKELVQKRLISLLLVLNYPIEYCKSVLHFTTRDKQREFNILVFKCVADGIISEGADYYFKGPKFFDHISKKKFLSIVSFKKDEELIIRMVSRISKNN